MLFAQDDTNKASEVDSEGSEVSSLTPQKKTKLVIILAIAAITVLLASAGIYFYFFNGKKSQNSEVITEEPFKIQDIEFVALQEMNINLKSNKGDVNILRATFFLEIDDAKSKEKIEKIKPMIIDQFQTYLRELDLITLRGSGRLERIRQDLVNRVNNAVKPIKIRNILFKEFLIQ